MDAQLAACFLGRTLLLIGHGCSGHRQYSLGDEPNLGRAWPHCVDGRKATGRTALLFWSMNQRT